MPDVCSVKFPYATRDLWFDANGLDPQRGEHVVCETERGLAYGTVTGAPRAVDDATLEATTNGSPLKPIVRIATAEDDDYAEELEDLGAEALEEFTRQVHEMGLDMKPVGVEFQFDGDGAVCYFVAENRVDFRQLARNLSRALHARVDLRQIGVREQASIMGGLAHCGQEYCCSRLGQGFGPVTIRMAKDQDLPLNSPKISGACGRLMCCLRYEEDAYKDFKRRAPKKNAVVETPFGNAKVSEFDTPRETVGLRLEDNRTIRVPLASMDCSAAAQERAERNGVTCRPDCVALDALERLDSPQIKLALAQLRAETELTTEDWMPKEDILQVGQDEGRGAPQRGTRRRRGGGEGQDANGTPRRRRRRRSQAAGAPREGGATGGSAEGGRESAKGSATGESAGGAQGQRSGEGSAPSRRRHHGQRTRRRRSAQRSPAPAEGGTTPPQGGGSAAAEGASAGQASPSPQPKGQRGSGSRKQGGQGQRSGRKPNAQGQRGPKKSGGGQKSGNQGQGQRSQRKPNAQGQGSAAPQGSPAPQPGTQGQRPPQQSNAPRGPEDRKPGRARRRRRRHGSGAAGAGGSGAQGGGPAGPGPKGPGGAAPGGSGGQGPD